MEHTQGFEFLFNVNEHINDNKSSKSKSDDGNISQQRRNIMLALETIVEFVEDAANDILATSLADNITSVMFPMAEQLVSAFAGLKNLTCGKCITKLLNALVDCFF
jgi:hypothetical protein